MSEINIRDKYNGRVIKYRFRNYIVFWTEMYRGKVYVHAATKDYRHVKMFRESKVLK